MEYNKHIKNSNRITLNTVSHKQKSNYKRTYLAILNSNKDTLKSFRLLKYCFVLLGV